MDDTGIRAGLTRATRDRFKEAASRYREDAGEMTVCQAIGDDAEEEFRVAGNCGVPWEVEAPDT